VTIPPTDGRAQQSADPKAIAREYLARLPGLAETFEPGGSQMHATSTIDYALILELELDGGETVHLCTGDFVVQQATRHGWRNKGQRPATIVFFMLGSKHDDNA
jgi:hypothetical protein